MDDIWGKIFNAATGVWAIFCTLAVALFKMWPAIMGRWNERRRDIAAEEDRDWARLRHERDHAREAWVKCDAERICWMERAVRAEATLQGYGEARQKQAIEEAAKRLRKPENNNEG